MSLDFWVINGKIPSTALKSAIRSGKIKGVKLIPQKGEFFAIQYDKNGVWNAEDFYKGNVTWFVEYAGGHGNDKAMDRLITQLETVFKCEITMDEYEYSTWVKKTTGKALPKDPHAGCNEVEYTKDYPEGKCVGNHAISIDRLLFGGSILKQKSNTKTEPKTIKSDTKTKPKTSSTIKSDIDLVRSLWG